MMFQGEYCHTLQTQMDNKTIKPKAQRTSKAKLDAIQTTTEQEEHI